LVRRAAPGGFAENVSEKLATILMCDEKLRSMDRYERRALSRRRFAIPAFDNAAKVDTFGETKPENVSKTIGCCSGGVKQTPLKLGGHGSICRRNRCPFGEHSS
jgi:hypothetical protein